MLPCYRLVSLCYQVMLPCYRLVSLCYQVLEEQKSADGRNTIKLFSDYGKRPDSTVNKVVKALEEMNRGDALKVLLDAMPGAFHLCF